jgi:hypothetical protein
VTLPDGRHVFARLELVFCCNAFNREWQTALVTLFKTVVKPQDSGTRMRKIYKDNESAFINISCIQRSVYAVPDFHDGRLFTLIDVMDPDMYLRLLGLEMI